MTAWAEYLDELEAILDAAEAHIEAADVDGATTAISALDGPELGHHLPDLTSNDARRARAANGRLAVVEAWIREAMARVRPELALVGRLVDSGSATSRYVDQPA